MRFTGILFLFVLSLSGGLARAQVESTELQTELTQYLNQTKITNLERALFISRLTKLVFSNPMRYEARVREIDSYFIRSPEKIADIGYALQKQWESKYAAALLAKSERGEVATKTGAVFGLTVLSVSLIFFPENTSAYFKIFRQAFPLLGAVGGKAIEGAGAFDTEKIPPAPAHLMRVGMTSELEVSDLTLGKVVKMIAPLTAGTVAYESLMTNSMVRRTAVGKFNIIALIGSAAAGMLTDRIITWHQQNAQRAHAEQSLQQSVEGFLEAVFRRDDSEILEASGNVTKAAMEASLVFHQQGIQAEFESSEMGLARDLRSGVLVRDSIGVLVQARSLIQATKKTYLQQSSDILQGQATLLVQVKKNLSMHQQVAN